ncbi:calcium-dependent protein kinase 27-like [Dorcoceras hygrometricum]|uniref:Calcium-dependent protein kinase 27-like n=1 Tax=Dorcoceras hygrometricum TaxID=472368 RepID=A0A2Z7C401_9LAMI|nr:calcium-dependent protein kinase 27-like [Dorcoceras hygrometricum]
MSSPDYDLVVRSAESIDHSSTPEASNREDENLSLTDNYRARILRIDEDEARLTARGCACRPLLPQEQPHRNFKIFGDSKAVVPRSRVIYVDNSQISILSKPDL